MPEQTAHHVRSQVALALASLDAIEPDLTTFRAKLRADTARFWLEGVLEAIDHDDGR